MFVHLCTLPSCHPCNVLIKESYAYQIKMNSESSLLETELYSQRVSFLYINIFLKRPLSLCINSTSNQRTIFIKRTILEISCDQLFMIVSTNLPKIWLTVWSNLVNYFSKKIRTRKKNTEWKIVDCDQMSMFWVMSHDQKRFNKLHGNWINQQKSKLKRSTWLDLCPIIRLMYIHIPKLLSSLE